MFWAGAAARYRQPPWRGDRGGDGRNIGLAPSGVAYVVLVFLGSAVIGGTSGDGRHSLDATAEDVATYVREGDTTRVWAGEYVAVIGYVLFVVFAAYVVSLLTVDEERGWARAASLGAASIYVGLAVAATACLAAVLNRGGDPEAAARFLDLRTVLFGIAFLFFALWLLTIGGRVLRTGALPRWLGWAAIVIAILQSWARRSGRWTPGSRACRRSPASSGSRSSA
jgi:hypothetical protein